MLPYLSASCRGVSVPVFDWLEVAGCQNGTVTLSGARDKVNKLVLYPLCHTLAAYYQQC